MITIVDYGMGNLGSICNMFRRLGVTAEVTGDPARIAAATKLLLPGVGAFDSAMFLIQSLGLRKVLDRKALSERVPVLGICLGMQLLTGSSEEGQLPGLGWVDATTLRFPATPGLPVPHMGWNLVQSATPSPLTAGLGDESRFYFVHSYYVRMTNPAKAILTTTYGIPFHSALQDGNIFGAQFHPEKSHKFGMQLLKNFAAL
jgi:imidazole glycerol-phosphate synthase subunit HisH